MIEVEKATQLVEENTSTLEPVTGNISDAMGSVLSKDVISPIQFPPFNQSAMDGYAVNSGNGRLNQYKLTGEIKAGDPVGDFKLNAGEAVRIFTGSPVPNSADTVIMQERIERENGTITITTPTNKGANIRHAGEQIEQGDVALECNQQLGPASIGLLAMLGISEVSTYRLPRVTIISSGNELVPAGDSLNYGQIYESNAIMLESALEKCGFSNYSSLHINDTYEQTKEVIEKELLKSDVLLISGGISVGDYDFVGKALNDLGVNQVFYKVNQKPGKPLYFGTIDNKLVFALPGNPAAALTCFYLYALPALRKLKGEGFTQLLSRTLTSKTNYIRKGPRSHILKAKYKGDMVELLEGQSSSMLHTYALSNALVYIPNSIDNVAIGDTLSVYILP